MAKNYLNKDDMISDLDQNEVEALEILAESGQAGLDAWQANQDARENVTSAAGQSWEDMVGNANAPDQMLAELEASRSGWDQSLTDISSSAYEGFDSRMASLKNTMEGYYDEFRGAAPAYERLGAEEIAKKAAAREAARLAKIEKVRKDSLSTFNYSLRQLERVGIIEWDNILSMGANEKNSLNYINPDIQSKIDTMPPQLQSIMAQLDTKTSEYYIPFRILVSDNVETELLKPDAFNAISGMLAATYPDMDPNIFLSYFER